MMERSVCWRRRVVAFACLMALFCCLLPAPAATYFVSNAGSDDNPGDDVSTPFQTLKRASSVLMPGDVCLIRGGTYRETLRPERSGRADAPITFQAYPGEQVTISGADLLGNWTLSATGLWATRVDWDLGPGHNQLFLDGTPLSEARYPAAAGDLLHPTVINVNIEAGKPNVITSKAFGGRPVNFWAGAWFCGGLGVRWSWQCARVAASSGDTITVEPGTKSQPWFTGEGVGYLWGAPSFLHQADGWNLKSSTAGDLLQMRLSGIRNIGAHQIELKRRNWCVDIDRKNFITVQGVWLRAGAVRIRGVGNHLENCNARYLSHFLNYTCGYAHNGGYAPGGGIVVDGLSNSVNACVIYDTAGSGISCAGKSNRITHNSIRNTDYSGTYGCAIRLDGRNNQVTFNTALCSGRDILQPGGAGHDILFNDFSFPGQLCHDVGVIYIWGTNAQLPDGRRTRVGYNWIHDNPGPSATCPLVYLDNYSRNFVIDHNVIWGNVHDAGIRINGPASGHRIYNNTLFNCADIGTGTYDMWPNKNPDPSFWTGDTYQYSSINNLFLGGNPQSCLRDWRAFDFRPLPGSVATASGTPIPGYTEHARGTLNTGAYETNFRWTPGIRGSGLLQSPRTAIRLAAAAPMLSLSRSSDGLITLTAPLEASAYRLYSSADLGMPLSWSPVTNTPVLTESQWMVTLPLNPSPCWFRLQSW